MPTVIEFFGLPGSGKSTIAAAVQAELGAADRKMVAAAWKRESFTSRLGYVLSSLVDLPLILAALRLAILARLWSVDSWRRLTRLLLMRRWWIAQSAPMLFDQALLQNVWSLLIASGRTRTDPAIVVPLLRAFYRGMKVLVIVIEVEPAVAAHRIVARVGGNSRFDRLSAADAELQVSRSVELVKAIAEACRRAGLTVQSLDGSATPGDLAGKCRRQVDDFMEQDGRPNP